MTEIPKDLKFLLFGMGPKWHAKVSMTVTSLSIVCIIVGIIGDVANRTPGLSPSNWFLLAIALGVWCLSAWFCSYFSAKEG